MFGLVAALILCVAIHLMAIALAASMAGVVIRQISLGVGPPMFTRGVFRLGSIPTGGFVKFKSTETETVAKHEMHTALEGKAPLLRAAIAVSGCGALLVLAALAIGVRAVDAAFSAPAELLAGALSPWGHAQQLLHSAAAFVKTASFPVLLGVTAAKFAVFNLLPLPALNGGAAIAAIAQGLRLDRYWPAAATRFTLFVYLAIILSWALAILLFAFSP